MCAVCEGDANRFICALQLNTNSTPASDIIRPFLPSLLHSLGWPQTCDINILPLHTVGALLALTVRRVALRGSAGRRSGGMLTLRVEMAVTRFRGTGTTCISASLSSFAGVGTPAASTRP